METRGEREGEKRRGGGYRKRRGAGGGRKRMPEGEGVNVREKMVDRGREGEKGLERRGVGWGTEWGRQRSKEKNT